MLHKITLLLVILGATNIGLVSWFGVDVIGMLFGVIGPFVNVLIGLSGVYMLLSTYTTLLKKPA